MILFHRGEWPLGVEIPVENFDFQHWNTTDKYRVLHQYCIYYPNWNKVFYQGDIEFHGFNIHIQIKIQIQGAPVSL